MGKTRMSNPRLTPRVPNPERLSSIQERTLNTLNSALTATLSKEPTEFITLLLAATTTYSNRKDLADKRTATRLAENASYISKCH